LRGAFLHVVATEPERGPLPWRFDSTHTYNEGTNTYWRAVAERTKAILDASGGLFIALAPDEARDAIAAIDAGHVAVRTAMRFGSGSATYATCHQLTDECILNGDKHGNWDLLRAVNQAVWAWAAQLGYPMSGAWEFRTLAEWRAWLCAQAGLVAA
jgi:hypothetical protein